MSFLSINNISYTYPPVGGEIETDDDGNPIIPKPIFDYFSADLPISENSFTSLIGPNGSGKSTFMLLAAGRIKPQQGTITLFGLDIANIPEEDRNEAASFVYQNMEFEQDDPVEDLLKQVFENGFHSAEKKANPDFYNEVIKVFELENVLNHKLTGISKKTIDNIKKSWNQLKSAVKATLKPKINLSDGKIVSILQQAKELWNGFKIEVVDKLPEKQIPNTIYFVIMIKEEYINTTHDGDIIVDHDGNTIIF